MKPRRRHPELTKEYLYQRYVVDGLSIRQIAAETSAVHILHLMRKYCIPRRSRSEAVAGSRNHMHGLHHSPDQRAHLSKTLTRLFSDAELRRKRSERAKGSNNPMYGKTHSLATRETIRAKNKSIWLSMSDFDPSRQHHRQAMSSIVVRRKLSASAQLRTGDRNPFFGRTHSEATKRILAAANRGRFCGAKGSNWQGGKTRIALLIRNSPMSTAWRKSVFKRDSYTCQVCGKVGGPLHADHLVPFSKLLQTYGVRSLADARDCDALWNIDNGRTLCVPCHRKTPTYAGRVMSNRNGGMRE